MFHVIIVTNSSFIIINMICHNIIIFYVAIVIMNDNIY